MNSKEKSRDILEQIIAIYPDVKTILKYSNTFELLVAVMLSAQTTDIAVNKVTGALFERFPTPLAFAESSPEEIEPYIKSIGLYRNKAKHLYICANQLVRDFNSEVPSNRKDLESLAGVGRKTANVLLSVDSIFQPFQWIHMSAVSVSITISFRKMQHHWKSRKS